MFFHKLEESEISRSLKFRLSLTKILIEESLELKITYDDSKFSAPYIKILVKDNLKSREV
jgi:hypothetical protein